MSRVWGPPSAPAPPQDHAVPRWVVVVTVAAVSVVAAVAAVASYVHMHELAERSGEQWRAHLIPLSVDGLLVAASMVMLVRRRAGLRAGLLPWTGLVLGLVASLAANLAVARPDPVSLIVSGWPPLALAVAFELLILVTRDQTGPGQTGETTGSGTADQADPVTADQAGPGAETTSDQADRTGGPADRTDADLLADLRALADRTGRRPSGRAVRAELKVGPERANRLLAEFDQTGPRRTA